MTLRTWARTGEDAVWMAGAAEHDAIVLDVMLPGMDGFETLAALREQGSAEARELASLRPLVNVLVRIAHATVAAAPLGSDR